VAAPLVIEMAPPSLANDDALVAELTDLVNRVYAVAEAGLWSEGAARTNVNEVREMIAGDEIAVARRDDGQIVGSVRVQQLDGGLGEFGMLVADFDHRGEGVGRELVAYAESLARAGVVPTMQLELLVPREWSHPTKEFLRDWYTRIGYRVVRTGHIEESYPHLASLLATPCDFLIFHKPLT
jgi:GNAT superfamily N-acetyltransferase